MEKKRLDVIMVEQNLAASRERAKALIMAGEVMVSGKTVTKAGEMVAPDSEILVKETCPYVSRGGWKLEKAMASFPIQLSGKVCADIGASTGGFTDCMLQNGARMVYAVDVGYGQLDWKLRNDPRVVVMERTNARFMEENTFSITPEFASVDVSFISLKLILPAMRRAGLREAVTLIKPQFEAGREKVGKKGVVRDPAVHEEVISNVLSYAEAESFGLNGLTFSPIKGPNGNIEYLAHFIKDVPSCEVSIPSVVQEAFSSL